MYSNDDTIKWKLKELTETGGAIVFSLDDYYVQFSSDNSNRLSFEAVSHEFLDSVPESLTPQFRSMSFAIEPGMNYYKYIQVHTDEDYESIANECRKIFTDFYMRDYSIPLAVEEISF